MDSIFTSCYSATHNTMRNQETGTGNNLCQYWTPNTGCQPLQTAPFTFQDGACFNRQTSNWQMSAVPHQAVSSQQPAGGQNKNHNLSVLFSNHLNSTNMQYGNPCSPVTNGLQFATKQDFYQNSAQKSKNQIPKNIMTTYSQQDMSAHWNQPVTVHWKQSRTQDGTASNLQHCRVQKSLYQNGIGNLTELYPAYIPDKQAVCTNTLVSSTSHSGQMDHTQNHIQNVSQHGLPPSIHPPSYSSAVSQSFRYNSITRNSSSRQIWHNSRVNQKTLQHSAQPNSAYNHGGKATSSLSSYTNRCRYKTNSVLQKTNELHLNPAADEQQKMLSGSSAQVNPRNTDSQHKFYPAGSDDCLPVHTGSSYIGKQFVREDRITECNQTMQPATSTDTESYNSNASQLLLLSSGQSLPNTTQSGMSRKQHIIIAPPQQSSVPVPFCVTTTGDGSGNGCKMDNAFSPKNNSISKGNLVGSSSDASQLMKMPAGNSSQMTETLEMLLSVKQIDSSIHSSPGRTGTRAVAVVQPLSQESLQVANKHISCNTINQSSECSATDKSLSNPEKCISPSLAETRNAANFKEGFHIYPDNPNQTRSNKPIIRHSATLHGGTVVSSSNSSGFLDLLQKQLCVDGKGSEHATNMQVDQCVAPAAQQLVTSEVPVSQNANMDKSEMPTDPKTCFFDLSSIPTTPWKAVTLTNLILEAEKAQMESQDLTNFTSKSKILRMFWVGNKNMLVYKLKTGWYKDLITDVRNFCNEHVTLDSVILSQVKQSSLDQLKSYHVLKDNEVYSEKPYRSTWLNVNEQVDDTDKEFGIQWSSRSCLQTLEGGSLQEPVGTISSIPAEIISEVPDKVLLQTERDLVNSGEEKQAATVDSTSTQNLSHLPLPESADSNDPYYSFKIQVLPPEEAKVIFGQVPNKIKQSMGTDSQTEKVMKSVQDELPDTRDVKLGDSKLENEVVSPIEQVCCIVGWMEKIVGSDNPSLSKCQCKNEQNPKDCTDRTLDKEETTIQKNDKLCPIISDIKSHSAIKGQNQANAWDNIDNQIMTCSLSDLWNDLSVTKDLTEDDKKPHLHSDKETMTNSQTSINDSESRNQLVRESKDEDLSSSDIPNRIPDFFIPVLDPGKECKQDQLKSAGSGQSRNSDDTKIEIKKVFSSKVASHMQEPEEDCAQTQLTSKDVEESSLETDEEKTQSNVTAATPKSLSGKNETVKRKRKTPSSPEKMFTFLKNLKKCSSPANLDSEPVFKSLKCKTVFVDATDSEPSASNNRTIELKLFGSAQQQKCVLNGDRKIHVSSPASSSDAVQRPPETVFVKLSPSGRKSSIPTPSLKKRIYEKWWMSYLPNEIRHRRKRKTPKSTFASLCGVSLKGAEMAGHANTMELPVSSKMKNENGNTKCYLKRRGFPSNRRRHGQGNTRKDVVTLKGPNQNNGSHSFVPLKESNVLKFSVLPNTFDLADGSNWRKETTHPMSAEQIADNSDLVEEKDKSPCKAITRTGGTWSSCPAKKYCPLRSAPGPQTSSLFKEFQRRFIEKTQQSTDK